MESTTSTSSTSSTSSTASSRARVPVQGPQPAELADFLKSCEGMPDDTLVATNLRRQLSTQRHLSAKHAIRRALADYFTPVSRLVPAPKLVKCTQFRQVLVRDEDGCPSISLSALRSIVAKAARIYAVVQTCEMLIKHLQSGLNDDAWLEDAWLQLEPHFSGGPEVEAVFGKVRADNFKLKKLDRFSWQSEQELSTVSMRDILHVVAPAVIASSQALAKDRRMAAVSLAALVRGRGVSLVADESEKRIAQCLEEMNALPVETLGLMRQELITHFLPVARADALQRSLCVLAAHASATPSGLQRFVRTCEAQSNQARLAHQLMPPRWMIGLMRLDSRIDEIDFEDAGKCKFKNLWAAVRSKENFGKALLVRSEFKRCWVVMALATPEGARSQDEDDSSHDGDAPACTLLWFDPNFGCFQWKDDAQTNREVQFGRFTQPIHSTPALTRDTKCRLHRLKVTAEQCEALDLDRLVDSIPT